MTAPPTRDRAAAVSAIEDFAARLAQVREDAGNPSFREMAGRSGAISHATLHDAVCGHRLPSWGTVTEFALACGVDPEELRPAWQVAAAVVHGAAAPPPAPVAAPPMGAVSPGSRPPAPDPASSSGTAGARSAAGAPRRPLGMAGVVLLGVLAGLLVVWAAGAWQSAARPGPMASAEAAAASDPAIVADCPAPRTGAPTPPAARHEGDGVAFVADLDHPDCSHVGRGESFAKSWQLRNTGRLTWTGYGLQRVDDQQDPASCRTAARVEVPVTPPGALADVSAQVTAPDRDAFCYARFKLVDAAGEFAFPGARPVTFQLFVGNARARGAR